MNTPKVVSGIVVAGMLLAGPQASAAESEAKPRTGFVYDKIYLKHLTGRGHPERPQRLTAIVSYLKQKGIYQQLALIKPFPASTDWIETIHSKKYIAHVKRICGKGSKTTLDTGDTAICPDSYEVARMAVGGVLAAVDAVMERKVANAFCAVRPPGHHATRDRGMGFCIFNNVAIAARYVQKKYGLRKVLIVDWDVHHGNGTQNAFYEDATVLYFGTHQYPFYPGTGSADESGRGKGKGFTVNVPLPAGTGDKKFIEVFEKVLKPAALRFKPDFILISAGFDAHKDDLLGQMRVTERGFARMTAIVMEIADRTCEGRIVSVLEGGYNLKAIARSIAAHINVFRGKAVSEALPVPVHTLTTYSIANVQKMTSRAPRIWPARAQNLPLNSESPRI